MGSFLVYIWLAIVTLIDPRVRERLAPFVQDALDPVHEWATRSSVSEIARLLEAEAARGGTIPDAAGLPGFLASHRAGIRPDRDAWGTPYFLREEFYARRVASAGPDRVPGTEDDIVSMVLDTPEP